MKGIDEDGRLFGVINIIDAVGILLIIALVISAGAVLVSSSSLTGGGAENTEDEAGNTTQTRPAENQTTVVVHFQLLNDAPYIINGIDRGPVPGSKNIIAVLGVSQTTPVETGINNTTSNASLRLRLNVTEQQGRVQFEDERLYIGKQLTLDLGKVVVDAIITDFEVSRTATPTERGPEMTDTTMKTKTEAVSSNGSTTQGRYGWPLSGVTSH